MKPFLDLQMLRDATRKWRSSKATKQTRTRRCKTLKCCKMMLKRDLVVASTRHHCARFLKYYPRRPCAPSFINSRMLRSLLIHFLLFQHFNILGCLLGFWPLGQNLRGQKSLIIHVASNKLLNTCIQMTFSV